MFFLYFSWFFYQGGPIFLTFLLNRDILIYNHKIRVVTIKLIPSFLNGRSWCLVCSIPFFSYKVFVGSTIIMIRPLLDKERIAVVLMPSSNCIGWGRGFISMDITLQALQFSECRFALVGNSRSANFDLYWMTRGRLLHLCWIETALGDARWFVSMDDTFEALQVSINTLWSSTRPRQKCIC